MIKRTSNVEMEKRGLASDVHIDRTDPSEPLPEASIQATKKIVRGRQPLPSEMPTHRAFLAEIHSRTVSQLHEEFKRELHDGSVGHVTTEEDEQRSRKSTVEMLLNGLKTEKKPEAREIVIAREADSHQQTLDLIREEMLGTIRTQAYSGGNGGD